jgi:hypothetical protein
LYTAVNSQLSYAWAEVFLELMQPGVTRLSPVVVTISQFTDRQLPVEDSGIRGAVDTLLKPKQSIRTVASTIFPNSLWRPTAANDAQDLYDRYERIWPRIKRCRQNANGVYFQRFIAYRPKVDALSDLKPINQLKHIVDTYSLGNHRHSALQASVFDPTRDHSNARQRGFPCLQQVAFGAAGEELEVTGFYALQDHITKAYGNYVGLCWLGRFIAHQLGLTLSRVTCIASMLRLSDSKQYPKDSLLPLKQVIVDAMNPCQEQPA